nr:uncharacterized protein LOC109160138 isoform X2 [Ipomoea batatas]GMD13188.1 uncharacterized protein LOC109160138 isoform X2 [Ipomoea batatas]GMD19436.1 uncharacterized protein LOC109160138 isoform X2 [Ipomoea batatas]GME00845.1 uncharacterized protein LOC109160138 isoform X2 [Ipomoea batatas]
MDMDELHDWEVLQLSPGSDSGNQFKFGEFGADSDGVIRNDYFSVDDEVRYLKTVAAADAVGAGSGASDNPNWIDPALSREGSDEFCPESEVDRSEIRMLEEFEGKGEIGFLLDKEKIQGGFGGINETGNNFEEFKSGWGENEYGGAKFEEFEDKELAEVFADKEHETLPTGGETVNKIVEVEVEVKNSIEEFNSSWGGNGYGGAKFDEFEDKELVVEKEENLCDGSEVFTEKEHEIVPSGGETMNKIVEVEVKKAEVEKKSVVWWKAPFELLKYCMFRFKPVWTFSMAAALIGFAILGRRIYNVKKKIRSLELKVTMDDKKVSQFMSRAARLNEAFSVVKRVPVIRPQLPATGVAPWPVMTKLALQEA